MNQIQIDEINEGLYDSAKIFWSERLYSGWTSNLWMDLCKQGWKSTRSNSGLIHVYSSTGQEVGSWWGTVNMLVGVSKIMR